MTPCKGVLIILEDVMKKLVCLFIATIIAVGAHADDALTGGTTAFVLDGAICLSFAFEDLGFSLSDENSVAYDVSGEAVCYTNSFSLEKTFIVDQQLSFGLLIENELNVGEDSVENQSAAGGSITLGGASLSLKYILRNYPEIGHTAAVGLTRKCNRRSC
jgi:hypothetical protein